jgi:hypothetical protein
MSEPRHAMIFESFDEPGWWLHMVPAAEGDDDRSPLAAETFGPFDSIDIARTFADQTFQNTGFVIPVYEMRSDL